MVRNLAKLPLFKTVAGRQVLSLWASRIFEKSGIKRLFGLNLLAAIVFAGIVTPEANNLLTQRILALETTGTLVAVDVKTITSFENPLATFKLSQNYSSWHPGIDLVAPKDTPVYAMDSGVVEYAGNTFFGYGKHVIIRHPHETASLYAHLNQIKTIAGRFVSRGELIGTIGSTGWATGDHLHLEVFYKNIPINPLDVLPVKTEDIVYDGAYGQAPVYNTTQSIQSDVATPTTETITGAPQLTQPSPAPYAHTLDQLLWTAEGSSATYSASTPAQPSNSGQ